MRRNQIPVLDDLCVTGTRHKNLKSITRSSCNVLMPAPPPPSSPNPKPQKEAIKPPRPTSKRKRIDAGQLHYYKPDHVKLAVTNTTVCVANHVKPVTSVGVGVGVGVGVAVAAAPPSTSLQTVDSVITTIDNEESYKNADRIVTVLRKYGDIIAKSSCPNPTDPKQRQQERERLKTKQLLIEAKMTAYKNSTATTTTTSEQKETTTTTTSLNPNPPKTVIDMPVVMNSSLKHRNSSNVPHSHSLNKEAIKPSRPISKRKRSDRDDGGQLHYYKPDLVKLAVTTTTVSVCVADHVKPITSMGVAAGEGEGEPPTENDDIDIIQRDCLTFPSNIHNDDTYKEAQRILKMLHHYQYQQRNAHSAQTQILRDLFRRKQLRIEAMVASYIYNKRQAARIALKNIVQTVYFNDGLHLEKELHRLCHP